MKRAAPQDWYRIQRLSDDVTLIDEPHIHEFYRCNVWHVWGRDGDMLIDSGMGVVSLREWVPLVTERPLQAVASHTHFDHVGLHHEFPCRLCHAAEAHLLRAPTRENTFADKYVTDEFLIHTVYGCQIVVTNPTSSPRKLDVLLQIPVGAMPVLSGRQTKSVQLDLQPRTVVARQPGVVSARVRPAKAAPGSPAHVHAA